jgi:CheY-like chemotaxis protein
MGYFARRTRGSCKGNNLHSRAAVASSSRLQGSRKPITDMSGCTCDFCSLRIFVVEDHTDTLEALQIYLEQLGHVVRSARSKAEALKEIPMADCHILISDINLPDGNAWELMQELENLSPHYAIAMSGYGMKADCERSAIRFSPPSGQTSIAP